MGYLAGRFLAHFATLTSWAAASETGDAITSALTKVLEGIAVNAMMGTSSGKMNCPV
ncbi:UNVERIFIED_CONTAM: hypothetical protein FKN15_003381 [Acipenser sinensis]